ncbi:hypothetical protein C6P42_004512 [Pichia californica]|nr:hypothetical protein C6P42_004512 [[Candida] californica]
MPPPSSTSISKSRSTSSTPTSNLSPKNQYAELSSFNYHHEFTDSNTNMTKDHSSLFKRSLLHKWNYKHSILCMVASPRRRLLFCGTQESSIIVLDLITFQKKFEIPTHVGSVLCLHLSDCENILFSGGSDSLVKVWKIKDKTSRHPSYTSENITDSSYDSFIQLIPTHTIYSLLDIGDIFSITWIDEIKSVFIGAQNASLSFVQLDTEINGSADDHLQFMPSNRFDRFFDSEGTKKANFKAISVSSSPLTSSFAELSSSTSNTNHPIKVIQVPPENIISYAHNGYLYAIDFITISDPLTSPIAHSIAEKYRHIIVSAGGDGEIKLWGYADSTLTFLRSLSHPKIDSIFSLTISPTTLNIYAGSSDGNVSIWDLTTFQMLKIFQIDENNVYTLALSPLVNDATPRWLLMGTEFGITKRILSSSSDIVIKTYSDIETSTCVRVTKNDPCLTLITFAVDNESYLVSAGSDKTISLWSLESMSNSCVTSNVTTHSGNILSTKYPKDLTTYLTNEKFLQILGELISFKSVSKQPDLYMADCRNCANYLTLLFKSFGASQTQLFPIPNGNPIVHAIFKANSSKAQASNYDVPRILWYGHYDVIPASHSTWETPPFVMTPCNGYLYGRGTTDNKGPLLVSIFAIAELHSRGELDSDVVFLIEGEEEAGSWGFQNAVLENQFSISDNGKPIDWILLSNSYWLDDKTPALNYGLRGKIEISLNVWSDKPDLHSGVDGGVVIEPSMDLVKLLGKLVDRDQILIPGFEEIYRKNKSPYNKEDNLKYLEDWEIPLYEEIAKRVIDVDINELIRKWRLPSLSLHKIEMSGPDNGSVISQKAEAKLSIRIIPGQELESVKESFIEYVNKCFGELHSTNHIEVKIMYEAEPWLGDVNNLAYKTLRSCLKEEWGVDPIFVREGGSIPSVRFLEKVFACSAVHVPTGQSSDNAHLNNERVRILNLLKSKEIIKKAANRLPKLV